MTERIDVMWAGFLIYASNNKIAEHHHDIFHCIYVAEGVGSTTIDGEKYKLSPGYFYITGPEMTHSFEADEKTALKLVEIKFKINDENLQNKILSFPRMVNVIETPIYTILKRICLEIAEKNDLYSEIISLNLMEILTIIERNVISKAEKIKTENGVDKGTFSEVISYIHVNLHKEIELQDLADCMRLEKSYFLKKFKKKYKYTPMQYVTMIRIEKAKELLLGSDKNITQIAGELGYNSIHHFSSQFKRIVGVSPKVYVEEIEEPY